MSEAELFLLEVYLAQYPDHAGCIRDGSPASDCFFWSWMEGIRRGLGQDGSPR